MRSFLCSNPLSTMFLDLKIRCINYKRLYTDWSNLATSVPKAHQDYTHLSWFFTMQYQSSCIFSVQEKSSHHGFSPYWWLYNCSNINHYNYWFQDTNLGVSMDITNLSELHWLLSIEIKCDMNIAPFTSSNYC